MLFNVVLLLKREKLKQKKCAVYKDNAIIQHICQRWFTKFHAGNTTFREERTGQSTVVDDDGDNEDDNDDDDEIKT